MACPGLQSMTSTAGSIHNRKPCERVLAVAVQLHACQPLPCLLVLSLQYTSLVTIYRGITTGSVIAKLFAMIYERRLASWAEGHAVKAKGQVGFRKDFRTTDNIFVLRSLIDKQQQS